MTPSRQHSFIKKVRDISVGGALSVLLLGSTGALQSCSSNSQETEEGYSVGVRTYIAETQKGEFKIMDEEEVPVDSSEAIITYLDGKRDTLSPQVVKSLIDKEVRNNPHEVGQGFNLTNALLYGGMGYLLARTLSPNYSNFRNGQNNGYYQNPQTAQKASNIQQNISKSRTTVSKPTGAKSGYMKSSGRSTGAVS